MGKFTRPDKPPLHARVDWTNPLAKGLVHACLPGNGTSKTAGQGLVIDLVSGRRASLHGTTSKSDGHGLNNSSGASGGVNFGTVDDLKFTNGEKAFSVVALVSIDTDGWAQIVGTQSWNGTSTQGWYLDNRQGTATYRFGIGTNRAHSLNFTELGTPKVIGGVASASGLEMYVDGVLEGTNGTAYSGTISYSNGLDEFNLMNGCGTTVGVNNTGAFRGTVFVTYVWRRQLCAAEMNMLARDPYCLLTWEGKQ